MPLTKLNVKKTARESGLKAKLNLVFRKTVAPKISKGSRQKTNRLWGVGYRAPHSQFIQEKKPKVGVFEFISENLMVDGGGGIQNALKVRKDFPILLHGVSLSIAGREDPGPEYVSRLRDLYEKLEPEVVSDHLCWTRHAHADLHDLFPIPYTKESLDLVCNRIDFLQNHLGRRFCLENPSAYLAFKDSEMSEADFFCELVKKTGCGVLLDVNNLWVCQTNLGLDPVDYINKLPADCVGQIHIAGASQREDGFLVDTHDHPMSESVIKLLEPVFKKFPKAPVVLEWDDQIPEFPILLKELDRAKKIEKKISKDESQSEFLLKAQTEFREVLEDSVSRELEWHQALLSQIVIDSEVVQNPADERLRSFQKKAGYLSPLAGAQIYNRAFFLRHRDVLATNFKMLRKALGEDNFDILVKGYLLKHPPQHFSVDRVGEKMAQFLKSNSELGFDCDVPDFVLSDLARFEWERWELFTVRDEECKDLEIEKLSVMSPAQWELFVFTLRSDLRFLDFGFRISEVLEKYDAENDLPLPKVESESLVLWRNSNNRIQYLSLNSFERGLIEELHNPRGFKELVLHFLGESEVEKSLPRILNLILDWTNRGLFIDPTQPRRVEELGLKPLGRITIQQQAQDSKLPKPSTQKPINRKTYR